jgi:phosphonoacetaldehyde hydrolase
MALQALIKLSVSPVQAVVKIGDTAVDIEEGLNGGMWSVGVAVTGNRSASVLPSSPRFLLMTRQL